MSTAVESKARISAGTRSLAGVEVPDTLAKFGSGSDGGNGTPVAQRPSS